MTAPRTPDLNPAVSAARRRTPAPPMEAYDNAEIARGQADAVLGALGRMQLRLDVLAREQSEALARIEALLEAALKRQPDQR